MKRYQLITNLVKNGLSEKTLVKFSDKQINELHDRIVSEQPTTGVLNVKKNTPAEMDAKRKGLSYVTYEEKELSEDKGSIDESLWGITLAALKKKLKDKLGRDPKDEEVEKEYKKFLEDFKKEMSDKKKEIDEKKLSDKQSRFMDPDKDGDIDAKDLHILRKKKGEMKESVCPKCGMKNCGCKDKKHKKNTLKEGLSEKGLQKVGEWCETLGCRETAKKLIDVVLNKKVGLTSSDLSDTATFANGLDEIENMLEEKDFQSAYEYAKDVAFDMLTDEGYDEFELNESKKEKKWIQKAVHKSKKGSLRKSLGVKKGEKIPVSKLKAASKKGGKLGQRARFAMNVKNLKENEQMEKWVSDLSEKNYHPFTSKNEIINLIQSKLNESEKEALPDFFTYKAIKSAGLSENKPAVAPPKTKPGEKIKKTPFPGTGKNPKPKALLTKKLSENKPAVAPPKTKPGEKIKKTPFPGTGKNPKPKA
jgi:hypothetical protein